MTTTTTTTKNVIITSSSSREEKNASQARSQTKGTHDFIRRQHAKLHGFHSLQFRGRVREAVQDAHDDVDDECLSKM